MIPTPVLRRKVLGTPALSRPKPTPPVQSNPLAERARIANTPFPERTERDEALLEALDLLAAYGAHIYAVLLDDGTVLRPEATA